MQAQLGWSRHLRRILVFILAATFTVGAVSFITPAMADASAKSKKKKKKAEKSDKKSDGSEKTDKKSDAKADKKADAKADKKSDAKVDEKAPRPTVRRGPHVLRSPVEALDAWPPELVQPGLEADFFAGKPITERP